MLFNDNYVNINSVLEFTNKNKKTVEQLISPKNLPEAGFQSYGELVSDALDQKDSFIFGDVRNPELTHSRFQDLAHIDKSILNLVSAKEQASDMVGDPIFREAISSSLDFRAAEMEYVKLAARLEFLRKENGSKSDAHEVAEQMRTLGHELYGEPKSEIRDAALNELWSELDSKEYHESAQKIYDELVNGATWNGAQLSGLMRAEDAEAKLPRFEDNEALDWFGEKVIERNADIQALVNEYWTQMIEENGEGYECGPEDIVEVFQHVINMRDPSGVSGVSVRLADGRTALSWETPEMAVLVGSKRGAIKNPDELFRKVLHEFGVHGQPQ